MGAEQSHLSDLQGSSDFQQNFISFMVNGKEYTVKTDGCDPEIGPEYLLVDYLRDKIGLTGTKYMCREGGCGACMVTIRSTNPATGKAEFGSANSCLLPLFACDGLDITTVERLGNQKVGYHPIQDRLVKYGGTQCGFCTPGFVMNMYSVVQNNPQFTGGEVEYSFDGNICRCTGYRPIIDAFKSLSINPSEELKRKCQDIEDCYKCPLAKPNCDDIDDSDMEIVQTPKNLFIKSSGGEQWFKVTTLPTLFEVLQKFSYSEMKYRLVAGNTGRGIYKEDGPYEGYIEINSIPELHFKAIDKHEMVLGGNTTLTSAIAEFRDAIDKEGFVWAKEFNKHFRRTACLSVRNRGTLAGNLMLKHDHPSFVSDVFTLFESIGTTLKIGSSPTFVQQYSLLEFMELDMRGKVIISIHLPKRTGNFIYRTFKVGKRYQNAKAYVNAAFLANIDSKTNFTFVDRPSLVFAGINPRFIHAKETEAFLIGKPLTTSTLQGALTRLKQEAVPDLAPQAGTQEYRLGLAQSYLYKFMLGIRGNNVNVRLRSGAEDVERGLNTGTQTYDSDRSKWPLYQPVPKIESFPQASGEAEYINDIKAEHKELFGVFVLTTVATGNIKQIDASKALSIPDVVAFITAKDVPGSNNHAGFLSNVEEIFVSRKIAFAGQPVGLLVARNKYAAFQARPMVTVTYDSYQKPKLDIRESDKKDCKSLRDDENVDLSIPCRGLDKETTKKLLLNIKRTPEAPASREKVEGTVFKVKGEFYTDRQYHFHMETQICLCVPKENGMDVYSSTQHMNGVQYVISQALNVPMNNVNLHVRRLGGGFGAKISKAAHIAAACAVASHVTNKPVRVALDLETNMHMIGKRLPYLVKYSAEADETGKINKLNADIFCDTGAVANEPTSFYAMICAQSCYRANGWDINPGIATTDTSPNTYCRSPGSSQGVAAIETIMEHVAYAVRKDPLEVRRVNMIRKGDSFIGVPGAKLNTDNLIPKMMSELIESSDYAARKKFVDSFNMSNRWRKRGISMVPIRYPNYYADFRFPTFISVYHPDGTVNISHGGIEMGQGINTKVAQVVAHALQIPLEKVRVQPSQTLISPNSAISGASVSSELVCSSALRACEQLLERLEPVRRQLRNPTWEQLIAAANVREILLTSQYQDKTGDVQSYDIWAIGLTEIECDMLTGDYKIIRTDLIEDAGNSLSPLIDIGQLEGGLIMGLGWWLTEELIYDTSSGELLTDNTWKYKPMLPADIPEDIRITLLKNAPNPFGVLSSKATGEPPFNLAVSVIFALRNAIDSARRDAGDNSWYQMDGPVTRETIRKLALTSADQFIF